VYKLGTNFWASAGKFKKKSAEEDKLNLVVGSPKKIFGL
jgi:hypothetical protein